MPSRRAAHDVEHVADELGVERRGRLVEQHQLGLHRERARDRDPLLLAAGELRGVGVELVGEPDAVEQLAARAGARSSRGFPSRGSARSSRSRARSCAGTG
jgi:hypothetical protein